MNKVNMTEGLSNAEVEEQKRLGNLNIMTVKVGNSNKDIIIKIPADIRFCSPCGLLYLKKALFLLYIKYL